MVVESRPAQHSCQVVIDNAKQPGADPQTPAGTAHTSEQCLNTGREATKKGAGLPLERAGQPTWGGRPAAAAVRHAAVHACIAWVHAEDHR
jgi:hypothetical protein